MNIYFAPMEGITDKIYRNLHRKYFGGADKYFAPFLSPTSEGFFTPKDISEIADGDKPENNLIPQLLTKSASDFLWASGFLADIGYKEVNLNVGCPSGTVVAKGKGSGMLASPEALDLFLSEIFENCKIQISIKTRIGISSAEEFPRLLETFNKYPIKELTVHPRTQKEMYRGAADRSIFRYCVENTSLPICYNGDIKSKAEIAETEISFPNVKSVMLGRGFASKPWMFCEKPNRSDIFNFTSELIELYSSAWGGDKKVLPRMKEIWMMMITSFENSEKYAKRIGRSTDVTELKGIVSSALTDLDFCK